MKKFIFAIAFTATSFFLFSCGENPPQNPAPAPTQLTVYPPDDRTRINYYHTVIDDNQATYTISYLDVVVYFISDVNGNLVSMSVKKDERIIVDRHVVGGEWKIGVREEHHALTNMAQWERVFYSRVGNIKILIKNDHKPLVLGDEQGERLWEVVGGLQGSPQEHVLRTEGQRELRKVHEREFGILPPADKQFYLVKKSGLLYPVIKVANDRTRSLYAIEVRIGPTGDSSLSSR